ncbi:hypothetical protein T492DRAFT_1120974 [Pavlovales sp. CCMP2436]|nr:hypothetical protein T492DRAFT_1120974 [Pavlovales sp. CCMP2436]
MAMTSSAAKSSKGITKSKGSTKTTALFKAQLKHDAFSPSRFALIGAGKPFASGNLFGEKKVGLTMSFPCKIATALSDEESYGSYRLGICSAQDTPETAELVASLDNWTTEQVEKFGLVPICSRSSAITADVRNMATADGHDWSQLKHMETGVLSLTVRGIWRSEEIGGYGLMVKLNRWAPTDDYAPAASDPLPAKYEETYENVTEADMTAENSFA